MNFKQGIKRWEMLISYVTLDKLPNLFVPWVSFLENEDDNACLAVYLMGILAEQMSSCSVYEVLKGKMLAECKVCFCSTKSHHLLVLLLISACGGASAVSDGVTPQDSVFPS